MTPHIESKKEDISNIVIMPGDPLRAKYIAEKYLDDYKLVNTVRNMFAYTGFYKGKKITVFAHGMGIPSVGIYTYELFKFYDVEKVIRIGTAGAYNKDLNLKDLILVSESYSDSNYAKNLYGEESDVLQGDAELTKNIGDIAKKMQINILETRVHSTDAFYTKDDISEKMKNKYNCDAVEMETFGLFANAKFLNKKAAAILTISDNLVTKKELSSFEREESLDKMINLALETALIL